MIELFRQNFATSRFDQKKTPEHFGKCSGHKKIFSKKMITKKGLLCFTILKKGYTEKLFPSPQKSFLAVSPNKFYHKPVAVMVLVYGILTLADRAGNASQNKQGGRHE